MFCIRSVCRFKWYFQSSYFKLPKITISNAHGRQTAKQTTRKAFSVSSLKIVSWQPNVWGNSDNSSGKSAGSNHSETISVKPDHHPIFCAENYHQLVCACRNECLQSNNLKPKNTNNSVLLASFAQKVNFQSSWQYTIWNRKKQLPSCTYLVLHSFTVLTSPFSGSVDVGKGSFWIWWAARNTLSKSQGNCPKRSSAGTATWGWPVHHGCSRFMMEKWRDTFRGMFRMITYDHRSPKK